MKPKEFVLHIQGYDIPVLVTDDQPLQYDRAVVESWLVDPQEWGCDEERVADALSAHAQPTDVYLSTGQLKAILGELLDAEAFEHAREWFRDEVNPMARRLAKKVPAGSRVVRLNGLLVRQHQEYPWLYNLKDAHKSARHYFKSDASHKAKEPSNWKHNNKRAVASLVSELESKPVISRVYPVWHSEKGNTPVRGVWVCKELLYAYTEYLHPKLHLQILQVFAEHEEKRGSQLAAESRERRAKGTQAREDGKHLHLEFRKACQAHGASWIPANGELQNALWGKSKAAKMSDESLREPFRDNISELDHIDLSLAELYARKGMILNEAEGQAEVNDECRAAGAFVRRQQAYKK